MDHLKLKNSINHILKELPENGRNKNTFPFLALFAGILTGAITAILYTPDSGVNNRKKMSAKINGSSNESANSNNNTRRDTFQVQDIADEESMQNLEQLKEKLNS